MARPFERCPEMWLSLKSTEPGFVPRVGCAADSVTTSIGLMDEAPKTTFCVQPGVSDSAKIIFFLFFEHLL